MDEWAVEAEIPTYGRQSDRNDKECHAAQNII